VNHDVKNGLVPVRNVLRHLGQVARDEPERLAAVFAERRATLDSSVTYLETLAANYARLTPPASSGACDLNAVVRDVARDAGAPHDARVRLRLADPLPRARGDPVALRRILENLLANALDSLDGAGGMVTLGTEPGDAAGAVRVTVADTGAGMTREQLERAFEDFYTTKERGSGLGLSIVRRLVVDVHGALRVESSPGAGTCVTVELPTEAGAGEAGPRA
jgi:signal transduction histidine kinase